MKYLMSFSTEAKALAPGARTRMVDTKFDFEETFDIPELSLEACPLLAVIEDETDRNKATGYGTELTTVTVEYRRHGSQVYARVLDGWEVVLKRTVTHASGSRDYHETVPERRSTILKKATSELAPLVDVGGHPYRQVSEPCVMLRVGSGWGYREYDLTIVHDGIHHRHVLEEHRELYRLDEYSLALERANTLIREAGPDRRGEVPTLNQRGRILAVEPSLLARPPFHVTAADHRWSLARDKKLTVDGACTSLRDVLQDVIETEALAKEAHATPPPQVAQARRLLALLESFSASLDAQVPVETALAPVG